MVRSAPKTKAAASSLRLPSTAVRHESVVGFLSCAGGSGNNTGIHMFNTLDITLTMAEAELSAGLTCNQLMADRSQQKP